MKKRDEKTNKFIRTLENIECLECKKIFKPRLSIRKFCSRACYSKSKVISVYKPCSTCHNIFSVKNTRFKKAKYCTHECYSKSLIKPIKEKIVKEKKILYNVCINCNENFPIRKYRQFTANFCSYVCRGKYFHGERSVHWKKDRSTLAKRQERDDGRYRDWRKSVWLRDNFKCRIASSDCCGRIEAHHILPWRDYPELRYELNNGITLCHAHHPIKRAEEKRLAPIFQELVSVSSYQFVIQHCKT